MTLRVLALSLLLLFPGFSSAQEEPIGYLSFPSPMRRDVVRSGLSGLVISNDELGDELPERERSLTVLKKFDVFAFADVKSEKIAEVDGAGAMMMLRAISQPGQYEFDSLKNERAFKAGMFKVLVFEKKSEWVRVQFQFIPPWNGQDGWIKLGANSGTYVEIN